MSLTASATLPQFAPSFLAHPYASSRASIEMKPYAQLDDLTAIKTQIWRLLKQNKISRLPPGFPFQFQTDGCGRHFMSHASYDFQEYLHLTEHGSRSRYVTFNYVASSPKSGLHEMEWNIVVPDRHSVRYDKSLGASPIAQVKVDPMVMETAFGFEFMTNSRIIQEALALSIELGITITIQTASQKTSMSYPCRRGIYFQPGEIIFLATDIYDRSEVVFVYQP